MDSQYKVMGIVNVTHDSFYDGGRYFDREAAVEQALQLIDDGADILDIGGASTRPGAGLLAPDEEIARVVPVIRELVKHGICADADQIADMRVRPDPGCAVCAGGDGCDSARVRLAPVRPVQISVDTVWSAVARAAVGAGASWVNDISAGRIDPEMPETVARARCTVVLTHSRKMPWNMQDNPWYKNVVVEAVQELLVSAQVFKNAGVSADKIIYDPGFGFAKSVEHNIELLRGLDKFGRMLLDGLGGPADLRLLAGLSRKSFIGEITGRTVEERLPGTLAATAMAYLGGARIFRVHDVKETVDFLRVFCAGANEKKQSGGKKYIRR